MDKPHLILGIGELLWDLFPDRDPSSGAASGTPSPKSLLGGAPANFTVMAARLGNHAAILSRIGRDDLGRRAMDQLDPMPVDTGFIQVDRVHETGRVTVQFSDGEPKYTIHKPSAWDFLELSDDWVQLAERADAVCFGSLAQRAPQSRQTIQTVVAQTSAACIRVFDVNLRAPFYSGDVIQESLELATVLKMNEGELPEVLSLLGLPAEDGSETEQLQAGATRLLAEFPNLDLVAVTRGTRGSISIRRNECLTHPGYQVKVADLIGAGDAFTAAITHYLLRAANLATLTDAGNRWGSWIASQLGAMPSFTESIRSEIAGAIEE